LLSWGSGLRTASTGGAGGGATRVLGAGALLRGIGARYGRCGAQLQVTARAMA